MLKRNILCSLYLEQNFVMPSSMVVLQQKIYSQDLVLVSWEPGRGVLFMASQAADSLNWIQPCLTRMVVNMCRAQGNYRAGLYQDIWAENRQPMRFSAPREDGEDRDKAGLWCRCQLHCHQDYQGKMLEPLPKQQSTSTGMHVLPCPASGCPTVRTMAAILLRWGRSAEDLRMSLLLLTRVTRPESLAQKIPFSREHLAAYWWEIAEKSFSTRHASALRKQTLHL